MSKITVTGQLTLTGGQLTAKETPLPPLPTDQTLWSWGFGSNGALGHGDIANTSSPVQVGALNSWSSIHVGFYFVFATNTNNELWAWGRNISGQLGIGDSISRSSPVQVIASSPWTDIAPGHQHNLALKANGELWVWGDGASTKLGLGPSNNDISSPVQVGALTNWSSIFAGTLHSAAINNIGELFTWGENQDGRLGHGDFTDRNSPVQVGSDSNWSDISTGTFHTLALKTDGSLWAMGRNLFGALGINVAGSSVTSPVQIGNLTDWADIAAGDDHSAAVKSDGTLWTWGQGDQGELGNGSITNRSSPIQIGNLNNWVGVLDVGRQHVIARKNDGTIWNWGRSFGGGLGQGDSVSHSSPVQVGNLTTWTDIGAQAHSSVAMKP